MFPATCSIASFLVFATIPFTSCQNPKAVKEFLEEPRVKCYDGDGNDYVGPATTLQCAQWDDKHMFGGKRRDMHQRYIDWLVRLEGRANHSFCRNPYFNGALYNRKQRPFCLNKGNIQALFPAQIECENILSCEQYYDQSKPPTKHCYRQTGTIYLGTVNRTADGDRCLYWNDPQLREYLSRNGLERQIDAIALREGVSINEVRHNRCRNPIPKNMKRPWCYVFKGDRSPVYVQKHCDIPKCNSMCNPEMQKNPCLNNGACYSNKFDFFCDCPSKFTGRLCEASVETRTVESPQNPKRTSTTTQKPNVSSAQSSYSSVPIWAILAPVGFVLLMILIVMLIFCIRESRSKPKREPYSINGLVRSRERGSIISSRSGWTDYTGHSHHSHHHRDELPINQSYDDNRDLSPALREAVASLHRSDKGRYTSIGAGLQRYESSRQWPAQSQGYCTVHGRDRTRCDALCATDASPSDYGGSRPSMSSVGEGLTRTLPHRHSLHSVHSSYQNRRLPQPPVNKTANSSASRSKAKAKHTDQTPISRLQRSYPSEPRLSQRYHFDQHRSSERRLRSDDVSEKLQGLNERTRRSQRRSHSTSRGMYNRTNRYVNEAFDDWSGPGDYRF